MRRFLVRRFVFLLITLWLVSILVFALSRASGDPRLLYVDPYTTQQDFAAMGRQMGLDRPLAVQYLMWVGRVLRGDLGRSLREARPVREAILERVPTTFQLAGLGWLFIMLSGIPLGVLAAVKRGTTIDYIARMLVTCGQSLPQFWLGIVLILLFSVTLGWLPSGRKEGGPSHYVLPLLVIGPFTAAGTLRLVRAAMIQALDSEYIKFARAKGVRPSIVVWKHALRNAIITPLTYSALILAHLLTGTVLVETVFAWPGLGRLAIIAVNQNDFPLLTGIVLFFATIFLVINFVVDIVYAYVDPRIRYM
ncbi:MAG: ABC transporter permease [Chloroflexota bacterium]|nr:ABC transporter permease [Chloroflexota bacterium]